MIKNILIPTDFTIESLRLLRAALQKEDKTQVNVIFLHCIRLSDSITELLFFSKEDILDTLMTQSFKDACKIIQNKYASRVNSVEAEVFAGNTMAAFSNFLDANKISEVFIPKNYVLQLDKNKSFDPVPLIRKSKLKITEVSWPSMENVPEKNLLAELFLT